MGIFHKAIQVKFFATLFMAGFLMLYVISVGGCDIGNEDFILETSEPSYNRAKDELAKGNQQEALSDFLTVIDKRIDAPESHLEAGKIYLENETLGDPIMAIYHFKKYLELSPTSVQAKFVAGMIETAQKKFQFSLPGNQADSNLRTMDLEDMLRKVQNENLDLKQKIVSLEKTINALEGTQKVNISQSHYNRTKSAEVKKSTAKTTSVSSTDLPNTYEVQAGDTLSSISRKFFGTPNRWREIFNMNKDRMSAPEALKPGMKLRIK